MTNEFEISKENLYSTFSKYPFKSSIEGCPCCISDSDKSTLHSKQLRELEDEDLSRYAFKAMTTWDDVNDYKHYLPRIFELSAKRELIVDTFVTLGKLEYGKWKEWNEREKEAITDFLKAWWEKEHVSSVNFQMHSPNNDSVLSGLLKKGEDIDVSNFSNGLYFLSLDFGNGEMSTHKVLIVK